MTKLNRDKSNNLSKRIVELIDYKEITMNKLSVSLGLSNSYFSKVVQRNSTIGSDTLESLVRKFPDVNVDWLLTGRGQMIKEEKKYLTPVDSSMVNIANEPKALYGTSNNLIPVYNLEASAGLLELYQNRKNEKPVSFIQVPNAPPCDGTVSIVGDSMYPLLSSGDEIAFKFINDFRNEIFWGKMYLISVTVADEEYVTVKYVHKSANPEHITLVSHNKNHQDKEVHYDRIRAMAIVKFWIHYNTL